MGRTKWKINKLLRSILVNLTKNQNGMKCSQVHSACYSLRKALKLVLIGLAEKTTEAKAYCPNILWIHDTCVSVCVWPWSFDKSRLVRHWYSRTDGTEQCNFISKSQSDGDDDVNRKWCLFKILSKFISTISIECKIGNSKNILQRGPIIVFASKGPMKIPWREDNRENNIL